MRMLDVLTRALVIVGAVNWGLVGLLQFDLVAALLGGQDAVLARIVYILVGLAGLYQVAPLVGLSAGGAHSPHLSGPRT